MATERRVILVTRQTRLQELVARHNTLAQARFYLEHLQADFGDYLREDEAYSRSLRVTVEVLQDRGRYQIVDRSLLANFVFDACRHRGGARPGRPGGEHDEVPRRPALVGVNPEPARWDGILLPSSRRTSPGPARSGRGRRRTAA
jgi:hypothetical protein